MKGERVKGNGDIMSGKSLTIKKSPRPPKFAQREEPPHATSLRVSPSPRHSYRNYLGGHDMKGEREKT